VSPLLFDQNASFAMLALAVLFLRGRQCHRAPNSRISTFIGDEPTHQRQDIDPIGFCAARSSIDLKAGWFHYADLPTERRESASEPKTVVADLVAAGNRGRSVLRLRSCGDGKQVINIPSCELVKRRPIFSTILDSHNPRGLAQLDGDIKNLRGLREI
jgi:hypothetical protein